MKKYIVGAVLSLGILISPTFTQAVGLTTGQANSLIAVVQSAPGVPASAFVNLITSFSNITTNQATSLIAVVQSAPGAPASAFVNLLISFTSDTTTQVATPATNQAVTPTTQPTTTTATTPTLTFTANPTSVSPDQTVKLTWSSTNTTSCEYGQNGGGQPLVLSGTDTASPRNQTIYITCKGPGGTVTKSVTITTINNTALSATIDQNSLIVTAGTSAVISGTASNVSTVHLTVAYPNGNSSYVPISVINGRWSTDGYGMDVPIGNITASVTVRANNSSGAILATGTLTITSSAPTATIDQSSLNFTLASPVITGTAKNTSSVYLKVVDSSGIVAGYNDGRPGVVGSDGKWTSNLSAISSGTYTVQVYANIYDEVSGNNILTTGTLTVNL